MEPRRRRLGASTLPWNYGEKKRIKGVWVCLDMFGREIRERSERIYPEIAQNIFVCVCVQNEGFGGIYGPWHAFWGLLHLVGVSGQAGSPTRSTESTRLTLAFFFFRFWFWLRSHIWWPSWTQIKLILVSLESYGCLVSRTLKKLKCQ